MKAFGCAMIGVAVALILPFGVRSVLATVLLCLAVLMISDGEGK